MQTQGKGETVLAETTELRTRLARRNDPADVAVALRLRGLPLRGPWPQRAFVVVRGRRIGPDPRPGYLRVDGQPTYSADWL